MDRRQLGTARDQLCELHMAIGRLQRVINLNERRGTDCTPVRKLIEALREHAEAVRRSGEIAHREIHRRKSKLIGLAWQLPLVSWIGAML